MARYYGFILFAALIGVGAAEPAKLFNPRFQNRNRLFARQEVAQSASPAPAPYPPAGTKPDIPFELPNEVTPPFVEPTYGPPDQSYGPPDQTYGPPDQTYGPPDQTYGPPPPSGASPGPEDFGEQVTDEPEAERLTFVRRNPNRTAQLFRPQSQRQQAAAPRRRVAPNKFAALRQPAKLQSQTLIARPILLQDGSLVYSIIRS